MACFTKIFSVENTVNKLHIRSDLHSDYIHNVYHDKQDIINELFYQYNQTILKYIGHTELIQ